MKAVRNLSFPLFLLLLFVASVGAEESSEIAKARKKLDADPTVKEVSDEMAKTLLDKVEEAQDADDEAAEAKAIEALISSRHEDFVKPLLKLSKDRSPTIRIVATKALGSQEPSKKIGSQLVGLVRWKPNDDYPAAIAAAISSLRRQKYDHPLARKEIESHFRKRIDTDVMRECVRYWGDLKVKDAVPELVTWVEAPQPGNPNDPNNPPASYWQKMWKIWDAIKEAVWVALSDITDGQHFRTIEEWREWLDSREAKQQGF